MNYFSKVYTQWRGLMTRYLLAQYGKIPEFWGYKSMTKNFKPKTPLKKHITGHYFIGSGETSLFT